MAFNVLWLSMLLFPKIHKKPVKKKFQANYCAVRSPAFSVASIRMKQGLNALSCGPNIRYAEIFHILRR